ncbi:MAG TPA: Shedu immune nuclease family protein [Klebsiella sp.]|jgi:hypothetical protein
MKEIDKQDFFYWNSNDEVRHDEDKQPEENIFQEEPRLDKDTDPNAFLVTLQPSIINGEDCVEIYAHGETRSFTNGEMVKRTELLARVTEKELTMYPLVAASYRSEFLEPKYDEITSIVIIAEELVPWAVPKSIEEFDDKILTRLPIGFGRHAKYGLGVKWKYRLIPEAILELIGVTTLIIESGNSASADLPNFRLGIERFKAIRQSIDTIADKATKRSLRDRRLAAYNATLNIALPDQFERRFPEMKPGEIYELVQLHGHSSSRSAKDRLAVTKIIRDDAEKIATEQPSELLQLKTVIEQVTLKELINKFGIMLSKDLAEKKWQAFFKANPFVLSLAFPYPVILFQDEANVGGTTLRGNGESIVDFLMAQRFTGNLALIEIKRPSTRLVDAKPYRGDLHAPYKELTASISQVLDQRAQLLHHFAAKKSQDRAMNEIHVSSVNCIVIIGSMPEEHAQKRSLDLFRHSLKDVVVITFDELLEKLKELQRIMCATAIDNVYISGCIP